MNTGDTAPGPIVPRIEIVDYPDLDLGVLSPQDVVHVWRFLSNQLADESHPDFAQRDALFAAIGETVDRLPEQHPDFGAEVYTAFAISPLADDREDIAYRMGNLARADHDLGLSLWDQLARDIELDVRLAATDAIGAYPHLLAEHNYAIAQLILDKSGLTSHEVLRLLDASEDARRGENLFRLGELALQRLTTPPQAK